MYIYIGTVYSQRCSQIKREAVCNISAQIRFQKKKTIHVFFCYMLSSCELLGYFPWLVVVKSKYIKVCLYRSSMLLGIFSHPELLYGLD